jgi:hypothetical protein
MNLVRSLAVVTIAVVLSASAIAAQDRQHLAHHPAGAASAPSVASMAMQSQMKSMQAMHDKMMAAKTTEERNALMAEHMKTMQEGMSMMQGMKADGMKMGPAARQRMMERRMDMMQSIMEMMVDRMPAAAPAK